MIDKTVLEKEIKEIVQQCKQFNKDEKINNVFALFAINAAKVENVLENKDCLVQVWNKLWGHYYRMQKVHYKLIEAISNQEPNKQPKELTEIEKAVIAAVEWVVKNKKDFLDQIPNVVVPENIYRGNLFFDPDIPEEIVWVEFLKDDQIKARIKQMPEKTKALFVDHLPEKYNLEGTIVFRSLFAGDKKNPNDYYYHYGFGWIDEQIISVKEAFNNIDSIQFINTKTYNFDNPSEEEKKRLYGFEVRVRSVKPNQEEYLDDELFAVIAKPYMTYEKFDNSRLEKVNDIVKEFCQRILEHKMFGTQNIWGQSRSSKKSFQKDFEKTRIERKWIWD